ncbi:MAG: TetR family transcriptional regulator [Phenylobacterium sp.]|uniref:TetR/AcrR family transcriptional regulator n=1 Tax=Phenylobacterium sp. TaxID=1871053 RepID=UPI0025DD4689|nr:TetR/AcrR family transcriptional regulator [Phenylobacterium sp.]MBI1196265.1 TetR family transcriptional regulator [Phenylobacterium sp.]
MPPPAKHRDAIVDAAVRLFRQKGYAATGLAEIVEASGAPKGSVYHYFPGGKAAIGAAAVREAGRRVLGTVRGLAESTQSAGELVTAHAELLAAWMAQSGYRDGAPMTTVLLENAPQDGPITAAGQDALRAWSGELAARLERDGVASDRAQRLASLTLSALEGALVQARVEQSGLPLIIAAQELSRLYLASV